MNSSSSFRVIAGQNEPRSTAGSILAPLLIVGGIGFLGYLAFVQLEKKAGFR